MNNMFTLNINGGQTSEEELFAKIGIKEFVKQPTFFEHWEGAKKLNYTNGGHLHSARGINSGIYQIVDIPDT